MNTSYKTLLNAVKTALVGHTWTNSTPAIKKGPQTSSEDTGNIVIVTLADGQSESVGPGNLSFGYKAVAVVGLVPWADTEANEDLRCDLMNDIETVIVATRQPSTILELKMQSIKPFNGTFFGGNNRQYRGVVYTLLARDLRK